MCITKLDLTEACLATVEKRKRHRDAQRRYYDKKLRKQYLFDFIVHPCCKEVILSLGKKGGVK